MAYNVTLVDTALSNFVRGYRFSRADVYTDIKQFLLDCSNTLASILELELEQMVAMKFWLFASVEFVKTDDDTDRKIWHFPNPLHTLLHSSQIETLLHESYETMRANVERFEQNGSNWVIVSIRHVDVYCAKYQPLKGSSYVELPDYITHKRAVVNVKNLNDNQCFKWCILAALHPVGVHPERVSHYYDFVDELNFDGIEFPMQVDAISAFCGLNPDISVNVYSADGPIRPIYRCQDRRRHHVNLLLYRGHFCLIRHFDRLLGDQNDHNGRKHFCEMCLIPFYTPEQLANHADRCLTTDYSRIEMPDHEVLKFCNTQRLVRRPMVVYADFECFLQPIPTCTPLPTRSFTERYQKHVPCAFGAVSVKSCCGEQIEFGDYVNFTGPDCADRFLDYVIGVARTVKRVSNAYRDLNMSNDNEDQFLDAGVCWICQGGLENDGVRDHCHVCGKFRGAAHSRCNSELQTKNELIVLLHNLRRYDGHILIRAIGDRCAANPGMKIDCIAKAAEDYISFTLSEKCSKRRNGDNQPSSTGFRIRFLDSCQFLLSSLDALAASLPRNEFVALERFFGDGRVELLKRKGVFAYDYLDSWEKLDAPNPPPRPAFFNQLTDTAVSEADYQHMLNVWDAYQIATLKEYMELYLKTDVLILCDVFENFRRFALASFGLDPCHYFTLPSFSWDACLKLTEAEIELISDPDMYTLYEAGIKGGVSIITKRYAKANNPYLASFFDPELPLSYLLYIDENNLYGGAMEEKHAVGGYEWLTDEEIEFILHEILNMDFTGDTGMVLVVDLEYPELLHKPHNCYPLAPEKLRITEDMLSPYCKEILGDSKHTSMEKLVPNLRDKTEYPVDARILQFFIRHGLNLTRIHRGIKYIQRAWIRPYIEFNTVRRRAATCKLQKNFFKLMNNSVYGKTMENPRKFIDLELVTNQRRFLKVTRKPEFVRATVFTENLVACLKQHRTVKLNKPICVGFSVLELAKMVMYRFHYEYIRPKYGDRAVLCMSDTDSFLYHIKTEDVYRDMLEDQHEFDTSGYPEDHFLYSTRNKGVLCKMSDETNGTPILEFVGLRAKMYSFLYGDLECKRAKGVKRCVVQKTLTHADYRHTLDTNQTRYDDMRMIRSFLHELYSVKLHKKSLASFDDKRYVLADGISTLAYGHCEIPAAGAEGAEPPAQ